MENRKTYYKRKLPHILPSEATFFVTYRLAGSMPKSEIERLRDEHETHKNQLQQTDLPYSEKQEQLYKLGKRYFVSFEAFLDTNPNEPYWLRETAVRDIVSQSLRDLEQKYFQLWAFCIMPNHVHALFTPFPDAPQLFKIMQVHKRYTAWKANEVLGRSGTFWEAESYDHYVRDDAEFHRIVHYIAHNPVKAGFVTDWQQWPGAYVHPDLLFW